MNGSSVSKGGEAAKLKEIVESPSTLSLGWLMGSPLRWKALLLPALLGVSKVDFPINQPSDCEAMAAACRRMGGFRNERWQRVL